MMDKIYSSAADWWLVALMVTPPVIMLAAGVTTKEIRWVMIGGGLFTTGLIAVLTLPCRYTLTKDALKIRGGILVNSTIPLTKIHNAEKTHNPLSAPALSINRVAIRGANGKLLTLISPKDRDAFIADLKSRLPER
ncbi:MAG: PH domain-containing protein [Verrucomicrobiales bacterium]|jgi:membrane protein YdbS with pleckstrin-like domain|nr:PH domain-containing protein [Verrucomicrobiales bacterium]